LPPSPFRALPPAAVSPGAAPKCISGRTSYLRVRLAFHPYPQLIQQLCNAGRFGPPSRFNGTSPWPWVAHPVSGPIRTTNTPSSDSLSLRLTPLEGLNLAARIDSPAHSSIGTPSPRLPGAPTARRQTVSGSISLASRPSFHLSLTVLVRYRSPRVFSLGKWASQLPTGFHVSRGTRETTTGRRKQLSRTGLSPSAAALPRVLPLAARFVTSRRVRPARHRRPHNPARA
jgi:hypothetical protein